MDMFDPFGFKDIERSKREKECEFEKLALDPCAKRPKDGDRVVVAVGLIGYGFNWVRQECVVLESGDTSFKVQWKQYSNTHVEWVHQNLITDVIGH